METRRHVITIFMESAAALTALMNSVIATQSTLISMEGSLQTGLNTTLMPRALYPRTPSVFHLRDPDFTDALSALRHLIITTPFLRLVKLPWMIQSIGRLETLHAVYHFPFYAPHVIHEFQHPSTNIAEQILLSLLVIEPFPCTESVSAICRFRNSRRKYTRSGKYTDRTI